MTDQLTDEAVTIGLDADRIKFFADRLLEVARIKSAAEPYDGEADREDLASYAGEVVTLRRALLAARAELDRLRADAQAAVALALEEAAGICKAAAERYARQAKGDGMTRGDMDRQDLMHGAVKLCEATIRALADADALAAVEALRAELRAAICDRDDYEEWWLASRDRADRLAAELAAAQQREAGLREGLERIIGRDSHIDASIRSSGPDRVVVYGDFAQIARAALSHNGRGE